MDLYINPLFRVKSAFFYCKLRWNTQFAVVKQENITRLFSDVRERKWCVCVCVNWLLKLIYLVLLGNNRLTM
uniref:Uncharacterized protein n=1 Tax=Octopus bimaculoides TaxID=37653 RepID=A0A0L8G094_OCTBM